MPRSVKVAQKFISKVKASVQSQGYARQKDLAEDLELALATVSNFLNGKPVDYLNFIEICQRLQLNKDEIADIKTNGSITATEPEIQQLPEAINELEVDSFIYVERFPIESQCYRTLSQPGALLRVKAAGLMGKTSLMAKVLTQLSNQGYRTVLLNLHFAEKENFSSLSKFLQWFCVSVGQYLGLSNQLAQYWDEEFSSNKMNCTTYFEQYLLANMSNPLVLCLDEVERVFPYKEVAAEFLGLLRAWHEQAKIRAVWKKLRLVVVHSTEVYVPLKVNESPFNVGVPIELSQFTLEQVHNLAQCYGLDWDLGQVEQLMELVGGHPYLVSEAFSHLKMNPHEIVTQFLETATTEAGIYRHHLRRYWHILEQDSELTSALKQVVMASDKLRLDSLLSYKLHSMGLVQLAGNEVRICCNLYRQYFSECLK
ncbi:MAG: AAA-like domain-containing protein [Nostoc sp. CmiSLP01]|nr:AAA-like domain-containing protein [Nostoc sp. CmiSLP01]MDZ8289006.1 AAA-like domain-containing protein [Nostoc sp. ChiSLP01]